MSEAERENGSKYSKTLFAEGLSKHRHLVLLTGHTRIHLPKPINAVILQKYRNQHSCAEEREQIPTFLSELLQSDTEGSGMKGSKQARKCSKY